MAASEGGVIGPLEFVALRARPHFRVAVLEPRHDARQHQVLVAVILGRLGRFAELLAHRLPIDIFHLEEVTALFLERVERAFDVLLEGLRRCSRQRDHEQRSEHDGF